MRRRIHSYHVSSSTSTHTLSVSVYLSASLQRSCPVFCSSPANLHRAAKDSKHPSKPLIPTPRISSEYALLHLLFPHLPLHSPPVPPPLPLPPSHLFLLFLPTRGFDPKRRRRSPANTLCPYMRRRIHACHESSSTSIRRSPANRFRTQPHTSYSSTSRG